MLNVLTIDFDIIMTPSIQLYNDIAGAVSWDELNKNPQLALSQADLSFYKQLTNLLLKTLPNLNANNVYFIKSHEEIVNILLNYNDIFNIVNIDHHHDTGYNCDFIPKTKEEALLNCGNWINYLYNNNKLNQYTWYRNINSAPPLHQNNNLIHMTKLFSDFKMEDLPKLDIIVLCLSPDYIPYIYRELFFSWIDICNFIYNKHFNFY